ncbi:peptidoglycan binding domain-containing protein [Chloropicon primus]|uniref:Peptidoglycan binding-like domain-containing protein n=1 Tax=Chloropicon primus TaxID=1764295 RepID=A0A5B8MJU5_9CHLO|nr:hypothetical protein A3770_04p31970 [Chloropicon primus]UPQ99891.1 peptidoglycan binding domain-containing protein [Chloropicon primus]|eukprot:QDZ20679.1 hypothetical protein A3770_04p31970 [Chloropicon primus]
MALGCLRSAPRRGAGCGKGRPGWDTALVMRRKRTQVAVSTSSYSQSVSNYEFATRSRELESKGVVVYDVGSTSTILGEGSAGFEVEELQRYLKEEGFYTSSYGITGYYGPVTKEAVTKWQKSNGVLATGNFGGMSRAKYLELQESKVRRRGFWRRGKDRSSKTVSAKPGKEIKTQTKSFRAKPAAEPSRAVNVQSPVQAAERRQGFKWGTALVFFVTLIVCWQTLSVYFRQKEEREVRRKQMESDRAVQISRWMRTIDTDRKL